jgi:Uma2 family endonuclease
VSTAPWPDHLLSLAEWQALPEDSSRRHELIEGVLLVVPRPSPLHQHAMVRLAAGLSAQLPDELTALADVEVVIDAEGPATVRAPDLVVVRWSLAQQNPARLAADDVLLAVEIVSPGTGRTDRVTKLAEYADAGIGGYWVIDLDPPATTMTAYTLVDGDYEVVADGAGEFDLQYPAPVHVDLTSLTTRR